MNELTLDPNEYGDLEKFVEYATGVTGAHKKLQSAIDRETTTAASLADQITHAEHYLQMASACDAFCEAYTKGHEFLDKGEIAEHIANLLDSYPSSRINNPRTYVRVLVEEIYTKLENRIVVECACRELQRTFKTPPPLAAVFRGFG